MTLHDDINTLHKRMEAAQLERTRAEGAQEHARRVAETAKEELKREFGVDTIATAEQLLEQMRAQLADQIAHIIAQLDEIGEA